MSQLEKQGDLDQIFLHLGHTILEATGDIQKDLVITLCGTPALKKAYIGVLEHLHTTSQDPYRAAYAHFLDICKNLKKTPLTPKNDPLYIRRYITLYEQWFEELEHNQKDLLLKEVPALYTTWIAVMSVKGRRKDVALLDTFMKSTFKKN